MTSLTLPSIRSRQVRSAAMATLSSSTTAIALETSKGDLPLAMALGIVLIAVVLLLNVAIAALRAWRERLDGNVSDVTRVLPA